jgi:hypothetical protein
MGSLWFYFKLNEAWGRQEEVGHKPSSNIVLLNSSLKGSSMLSLYESNIEESYLLPPLDFFNFPPLIEGPKENLTCPDVPYFLLSFYRGETSF